MLRLLLSNVYWKFKHSSRAIWKCVKREFSFRSKFNNFFNWLWTYRHSKQILDYFAVSESSICTVASNVINMRIIKTPEVFKALPWSPLPSSLRPAADFNYVFCRTQRLQTLPYNYRPTEKPLFAALHTSFVHLLLSKL